MLSELPADQPAAIVYIGDGMSAARSGLPAQVAELAAEMRGHRVTMSSFALGPQTDVEMLGTFAEQTGGITVLFKGTPRPLSPGTKLAAAAKLPAL